MKQKQRMTIEPHELKVGQGNQEVQGKDGVN